MPAFRSIRLWYLVVFMSALHATGCATSGDEKVVQHPIPHLYGTEDPQFSRTMGTLFGTGILEGNQVDVLLNGDEIFPKMLQAIRSAKTTIGVRDYFAIPGDFNLSLLDEMLKSPG